MSNAQLDITKPNSSSPRRRRKGHTCLNCRRRKIRCDGVRPICGLCASGTASFEDCEYPGEQPTATQLLERRIEQVKSRIRALEEPNEEPDPDLTLHHPYQTTEVAVTSHDRWQSRSPSYGSNSSFGSASPVTESSSSPHSPTSDFLGEVIFREPSLEERQNLLNAGVFPSSTSQPGFFLSPTRFYQSLMFPGPYGDYNRPTPALLSTFYLLTSTIFPPWRSYEKTLLESSLHFLAEDLSSSHPHAILHSIQAEVLLSYYYLRNGKMLEGNHHADAAFAIAVAANFHRIRSASAPKLNTSLPAPIEPVQEGENIDAFWAVLVLNSYWAAIQESHPASQTLGSDKVDTPWPVDSFEHEYHNLPLQSRSTLHEFLQGRSVDGISEKAMHVKSAILFERATSIHMGDRRSAFQSGAFVHLDSLIDAFKSNIPLVDRLGASNTVKISRLVTQMLLHAAVIKLHFPLAEELEVSSHKSLESAKAIARLTGSIPSDPNQIQIDPVVGVIWALACEVLTPLVLRYPSVSNNQNADHTTSLKTILTYLSRFSEQNRLFKFLMSRFEPCTVVLSSSNNSVYTPAP